MPMRYVPPLLATLLALLLIIVPGPAGAQVTTTGNIRVVVTDEAGLSIPGATVTTAAEDAATTRIAVTDVQGLAELRALNPSTRYVVTVELQGFRTSRQNDGLFAEDRNASDQEFSRFDTALTGGGPIVPNEAWFFGSYRRLSFNLGVRTERFEHVATDGTNIFTFDWTIAPRLSVSYGPGGNGQQRISAFYGKYYDPIRVEPGEEFEFAGITRRWLSPTAVGTLRNPSHGIVDLRLLYNYGGRGYRLELFADIFNLFDNQDAIRTQDLVAGAGGNEFGDGIRFTPPRRVFLGIRASFG